MTALSVVFREGRGVGKSTTRGVEKSTLFLEKKWLRERFVEQLDILVTGSTS